MMIWSAVGNKWLDNWTRQAANFASELCSAACEQSPIDYKDKEDLEKIAKKLNKINQRIYKRIQKSHKKK